MLELQEVSLQVGTGVDEQMLLSEVSARLPRRHFLAVLGPSGCGKTTLMKVIAGLTQHSTGKVKWQGRDLAEESDL
ncbi:MAG TPA: ATP-binding cassette domain-containing protein, partial [Chthoniobacteraceae bacterium]|nr:ATP-binding cassette domain-containing protein [Chthoniobacteraceae bacterium]